VRYSVPVKFIAIVLSAVALVAACASGLGIIQVAELNLYTDGFEGWVQNRLEWQANSLAKNLTERYAVRSLTNCPDEVLEELGYWYVFQESVHWTGMDEASYDFSITKEDGGVLAADKNMLPEQQENAAAYQTVCSVKYPVLVTDAEDIDAAFGKEYLYRETVYPEAYDGKPVIIRYYQSPDYTVKVTLDANTVLDRSGTSLELVQLIYKLRYHMMVILTVSLILSAAGIVFLCCAAGKTKTGGRVIPGGLNRLPLDLYMAATGASGYGLAALAINLINYWVFNTDNLNPGTLAIVGMVFTGISLLAVGLIYAVAAQIKAGKWYWWKHSVLGWLCHWLWQGIRYLAAGFRKMADILPIMWKYLLLAFAMLTVPSVFFWLAIGFNWLTGLWWTLFVLSLVADIALVLYAAYAYGTLLRGAKQMAEGELFCKIDTRYLYGMYRKAAEHLNTLADTAMEAAKNQMRSERMKTELITNISHDIKTPLTAIINYVDILQGAQNREEALQYLEVLGRQSQRLKKLIEDLKEMSRATTGNMSVDILRLDPVETLNQALGEFSDKLAAADLQMVFQPPETSGKILADGRLSWRVLSNLLSNIVKYAMPGTRVYGDVVTLEDRVLISLKNISREPLNIGAEELTERFVRGDASRNTEGSGLGLNIAQSLMELQKGKLQLLVDGDLFKVTLIFPRASE